MYKNTMIEVVRCYCKNLSDTWRKGNLKYKQNLKYKVSWGKYQRPEKGQSRKWRDEVCRRLGTVELWKREMGGRKATRRKRECEKAEEERRIRVSGYAPWCCTKILLSFPKKLPFANFAGFSFSRAASCELRCGCDEERRRRGTKHRGGTKLPVRNIQDSTHMHIYR